MLVEGRHLADEVITNVAGSESILCGALGPLRFRSGERTRPACRFRRLAGNFCGSTNTSSTRFRSEASRPVAEKGTPTACAPQSHQDMKLLKKFSPFADQPVKTHFNCNLPLRCARNAQCRKAANSPLDYMTKSCGSLATSIRIVFASLFLCLVGALPAFLTDGI